MRRRQSSCSRPARTIVTSGAPFEPDDPKRDGEREKPGDHLIPVLCERMPELGVVASENPV